MQAAVNFNLSQCLASDGKNCVSDCLYKVVGPIERL